MRWRLREIEAICREDAVTTCRSAIAALGFGGNCVTRATMIFITRLFELRFGENLCKSVLGAVTRLLAGESIT